jgi:hypothetical protein
MTSRLHKLPLALCVGSLLATGFQSVSWGAIDDSVFISASTSAITVRRSPLPTVSRTTGGPRRPAATLPVTSCADDGGSGTLRAVVTAAGDGDTVDLTQLTCGTITLLSGQIAIAVDDLTLLGPAADALTIDGNHGAGYQDGRVFMHQGSGTLTIDHLTIANGAVSYPGFSRAYGGCIESNGNVTVSYSTITGCALSTGFEAHGGGIFASGEVIVDHGEVSNNTVSVVGYYAYVVSGGGIQASNGPLTITSSVIDNNKSNVSYDGSDFNGITQAGGGGASCYGSLVTITSSIISNNFAGCDPTNTTCSQAVGGGIRAGNGITISASTFSGNVSEGSHQNVQGGAFETESGPVDISDSTFSYNSALGPSAPRGGAMVIAPFNAPATISGSTLNGNSSYIGGAIQLAQGTLTLVNTTISGNSAGALAGGSGGGVYVSANGFAGPITLENSTVTANTCGGPVGGGGIVDDNTLGISDFESSIVAGNINSGDSTTNDADLGAANGSITGASNLIIAASGVTLPPDTLSGDPMLGPLQDNGGLTWTHALLIGSPAIDVGNNVANLDFDQRGEGFLRRSGTAVDIGAFELQTTNGDVVFADGFDGASP